LKGRVNQEERSGIAGMLGVAYFGSAQQNEFDTYLLDSNAAG
jgi:ribose transport system permease protein